jgi:hypothetical protein
MLIEVGLKTSKLSSNNIKLHKALDDHFAKLVQGFQFVPMYKTGVWDGKQHFYNYKAGTFPTGLLNQVIEFINDQDFAVQVKYLFTAPEPCQPYCDKLQFIESERFRELFPYQVKAADIMIECRAGLVKAATNAGKCLGRDTMVMRHSGELVAVQNVRVGDLLMGDDSSPRRVVSVCQGVDDLYQVNRGNLSPYVVNSAHIISLVNVNNRNVSGLAPWEKVDIPISDYLNKSSWFKRMVKGYKVCVDFPSQPVNIDPYYLGLWLGDGCSNSTAICSMDSEIISYIEVYAAKLGLKFVKHSEPSLADTYSISTVKGGRDNELLNNLRSYNLINNKHIPEEYIVNSKETRLQLLAGFIDTDGYNGGNCYEVSQVNVDLLMSIKRLADSLGFKVTGPKDKFTDGVNYPVIHICGQVHLIPVKLDRKKCFPSTRRLNYCTHELDIVSVGKGEYFGFELAGNNKRFLLGDGTVTHNTEIFSEVLRRLGQQALVLVHRKELMYQTRDRLQRRLGIPVGVIGDGVVELRDIIVAMPTSMTKQVKGKAPKLLPELAPLMDFPVLVLDECQKLPDSRMRAVVTASNAHYRYAVSGTPFTGNQVDDTNLIGAFGDLAFEITNQELIALGVSSVPECYVTKVHEEGIESEPYESAYKLGIVGSSDRNDHIIRLATGYSEAGLGVLIIVKEIAHGHIITMGLPGAEYTHGSLNTKQRMDILARFNKGEFQTLVASTILDEGVDTDKIKVLILAAGGNTPGRLLQRLGRGIRKNELNRVIVHDFLDTGNEYLLDHSIVRVNTLRKEGFRVSLVD